MRPVALVCLLACLLLTSATRAAEPPFLNLSLNSTRTQLQAHLVARGVWKTPDPDSVKQAFQQAFGSVPEKVRVIPLQSWDDEEYREDDSEEPSPRQPSKPPKVTGFSVLASLPLERTPLEVRGAFRLAPLAALFSAPAPSTLETSLSLNGANAGHLDCTGIQEQPLPLGLSRSRRTPTSQRHYEQVLPLTAPPIQFSLGWSGTDLARALGVPLLVLLIPIVGTLLFRRRALRALETLSAEEGRRAVATGYLRLLNHGTLLFSPIWVGVTIALHPMDPLSWVIGKTGPELGLLLGTFGVSGPLLMLHLLCALISLPVIRRTQNEEITFRDVFLETGGQYLSGYLPFLCFLLALITAFRGNLAFIVLLFRTGGAERAEIWSLLAHDTALQRALGWLAAGFVARFLLPILLGSRKITTLVLQSGPLLDAVHRLATQMRVPVRSVLYIQTGKSLIANAFAAHGNIVALTDHLVSSLTRAETDAVIAHELGHLKQKHATLMGWLESPMALILAMIFLIPRLPVGEKLSWLYVPLIILAQSLLKRSLSRGWERTADRLAAQQTGNPAALLTGLAKLARINGSPESWTRWDESLLTHPSNQRRAENLIRAGLLTQEEAEQAFAHQETSTEDHYPAPLPTTERLFSPTWRLQRSLKAILGLLCLSGGVPLAIAAVLEAAHVSHPLLIAGAGILGVIALYPLLFFFLSIPHKESERLRQRLITQGKLTDKDSATFVGMTPGILPRVLATGDAWDYGFLVRSETALRFVGEHRELTIAKEALTEVALAPGLPAVRSVPSVLLRWGSDGQEHAACRLQCYPVRQIPSLAQTLKTWHAQSASGPEPESLPYFAHLEGRTPRETAKLRTLLSNAWLLYLMIVGIWAFSGVARGQLLPILAPVTFILLVEWAKGRRFPEKPSSVEPS